MNIPSSTTITSSLADAVDSIPVDRITNIELPDRSDLEDVVSNTSDFVTDSAVVLGAAGGRVAAESARVAWRNRRTVLTVIVLALAVVGAVTLWKSRKDSAADPDIA